jgi:hypothetical protein
MLAAPQLYAQTAPTDANPAAPSSAPSGQAPDEATRKITDLVHAGKYAEAQQLTNGLLIAYPDDQRLIKAKALIEKLLAPGGSTSAAPGSAQPPQPAANPNAAQLTGMDKIDYSALIVLARQAQQTTDPDEQKKLLQQFMEQSAPFLQEHPDLILLWQLRAASAISLNDPMSGYEAGQKLLAAGAADSNDPALQQLMGQLKNKNWLSRRGAEVAEEFSWLTSLKPSLSFGPWNLVSFWNTHIKSTVTLTVSGLGDLTSPVKLNLENLTPQTCLVDGGALGMIVITPRDAVGGIYTTTRTATLLGNRYEVPCTVKLSVVSSWGQPMRWITINNGH